MSGERTTWQIADEYEAEMAAIDGDADTTLHDLSIEAYDARNEIKRRTVAALEALPRLDVLGEVLRERLTAEIGLHECGFNTSLLAPLYTPVHHLRMVFDDLPRETEEQWRTVAWHLRRATADYGVWTRTLTTSLERGGHISKRRVRTVADQCSNWIDPEGTNFYRALVAGFSGDPALQAELTAGAEEVTAAAAEFIRFLREDLLSKATDQDGLGRDRYEITSRFFLGKRVDLDDLYAYGWEELRRLRDLSQRLGAELTGERDPVAARAALDAREDLRLPVSDELIPWLQQRIEESKGILFPKQFDLPPKHAYVEAKMSTADTMIEYYARPDDATGRPGRVWWAVPSARTSVSSWRMMTGLVHEGLPGHHLQHAVEMEQDGMHPWQRDGGCSSHAYTEGWAHYCERIAHSLGLLENDAELLGTINSEIWNMGRVLIDIGLHAGLPIPPDNGFTDETEWTYDLGVQFLVDLAGVDPLSARAEVDRYLGWPGQGLVFKVGSDTWIKVREGERERLGDAFDLKEFHMEAMSHGPMGLETLEALYAAKSREAG